MPYQEIDIRDLVVNPANDRHGELLDESAAIAELFRLHDQAMRNLAADIVSAGVVYDPPLVFPDEGLFVVHDGNRRVTCLKLLNDPNRAPNDELVRYFTGLRRGNEGAIPHVLTCQVEADRNVIDAILQRRHTGSQQGVGQISWNDRAKRNFAERTGQGGGVSVAAEIERVLTEANRLPEGTIPWSTMTRLLSSEEFRNRVGVSTQGRQFRVTHDHGAVLDVLERIARDLSSQRITLGNLWNNEGKRAYLDQLGEDGLLPREAERLATPDVAAGPALRQPRRQPARPVQTTFIPRDVPPVQWVAEQVRVRHIWEELQSLNIRSHPNAVSALMRILIELTVQDYIDRHRVRSGDNLAQKFGAVSRSLLDAELIDRDYFDELERMRQHEEIISVPSMQRYIHSPNFAPLEGELRAYWARLGRFLITSLNR